jgi:hypothetical protein
LAIVLATVLFRKARVFQGVNYHGSSVRPSEPQSAEFCIQDLPPVA